MAPSVTYAELKHRLCEEYGCEFKSYEEILEVDEDITYTYPLTYFERDIGDEFLNVVVIIDDENKNVEWDHLAGICRRLRIDPADFGLTLDTIQ